MFTVRSEATKLVVAVSVLRRLLMRAPALCNGLRAGMCRSVECLGRLKTIEL